MTGPAAAGEPTDRQLADIVRYLARACLEAERGLRPIQQLTRHMDPSAALRFRGRLTLGRFDGGPIRPVDVGPAHLTRHDDGTVFATVITRTQGRRWAALTLKLRQHNGRYLITDIRRLLATTRPSQDRARPGAEVPLATHRGWSR